MNFWSRLQSYKLIMLEYNELSWGMLLSDLENCNKRVVVDLWRQFRVNSIYRACEEGEQTACIPQMKIGILITL